MRILVTGGAGFIGHHLVQSLVSNQDFGPESEVFVVDKRTYAATKWRLVVDLIGQRNVVRCDVCDYQEMALLFDGIQPDLVFHLAAESHVDRSLEEPGLSMFVNAVGTQNVAQLCARAGVPLVYCSTDEVYGDLHGTKYDRLGAPTDAPLNPSSPYSAGKAAGEMAVRAVARSFGLNAAITRGCNAWGFGQFPEKLVPIACKRLANGESVPLHGGGSQVRQWVHVTEFAETLIEVGKMLLLPPISPENVITVNIWGPDRLPVRERVAAIARVAGVGPHQSCTTVTDRPGQDRSYGLDRGSARWMVKTVASRSILDTDEIISLLEHYAGGDGVKLASFCNDEVHAK